jgi:hypothetical protein
MLEAMRIEDEKLFRIVREERQIVGSKYTAKCSGEKQRVCRKKLKD